VISLPKWDQHADKRKRKHGIEEYQIAEAWIYGVLRPSKQQPGCWRCVGAEVTLVLNASKSFIITMYPNKFKDKDAGEKSANLMSVGTTRFEDE